LQILGPKGVFYFFATITKAYSFGTVLVMSVERLCIRKIFPDSRNPERFNRSARPDVCQAG
jgi:hypothetical protein